MMPGLSRQVLQDFSGGIFRNAALDRIPANGSFDILNGLLDLQGGIYGRGGSVYRSVATFGTSLRWIWDGWLSTGQVTLLASPAAFGRLNNDGTVTSLGEAGLAAPVRPAVYEGKLYFPGGKTYDGTSWSTYSEPGSFVTVAGNRLISASGSRVKASKIGKPAEWEGGPPTTEYVEIPGGVQILGVEGARDSCVVFTTGGVYVISNIALKLTDEAGNPQWRLDHYSGDIVLWGDAGIASWEGSLIVPGVDAVWLVKRGVTSEQVSSFGRISDSIRDLYRGYVSAGFTPGRAVVFNNHYLLPIIGAGRIIDFLVCRLDVSAGRGQPQGAWTRFGGSASQMAALATRVSSGGAREPELLGAGYGSARASTLEYFNDAVYLDADGSPPEWSWQTAALATGSLVPNLISRLRLRYQLQAGASGVPTIRADVASDTPVAGASTWGAFIWGIGTWASPGTASYEQLAGEAPVDVNASTPFVWNVRKKRRSASFRFSCQAPAARIAVKSLEMFVRPQGRL